MKVKEILQRKGAAVATVTPDDTIARAVAVLAEQGCGALVVSTDRRAIDGIISERDIVRALGEQGSDLLDQPVSSTMTAEVVTCAEADRLDALMTVMTEHRIRHLPVVADGAMVGIISIGDVVKYRVDELESEARHMADYISGR